MKDFPYTELQRAWLEDLKTTEEPQTTGVLHKVEANYSAPAGYCCLGRACVVAGVEEEIRGAYGCFDGNRSYLPNTIWNKLQLRNESGTLKIPTFIDGSKCYALTSLNDTLKWSFKQIAEWIEDNPELVFTNCETNCEEDLEKA